MPPKYCPRRGDIVWLTFDPQTGHEQSGKRPAFILSPESYNSKVDLALLCPVTHQKKGYPFEVEFPKDLDVSGVVLADQIKSVDWRARKADYCSTPPERILLESIGKAQALLKI